MNEKKNYRLVTRGSPRRPWRYLSYLYDGDGRYVDLKLTDTRWGARLWARRATKRHRRGADCFEYEVPS